MARRTITTPARKGVLISSKHRPQPKTATQAKPKPSKTNVKDIRLDPKNYAIPFAGPGEKIKGVPFVNIYANSIAYSSKNVGDVTVVMLKEGKVKGWPGVISKTVTVDGKSRPRTYNHHIVARDFSPKLRFSKAVHVSCQCPDFCFRWEYALHSHGAADIKFCNGEPPIIKNPSMIPGMCKHGLAVMEQIARKKL